jgi:hypothetical protein
MTALISKPETRAAGVTMLGKTVELCLDLLKAKCDPVKLKELSDAVRAVLSGSNSARDVLVRSQSPCSRTTSITLRRI